MVSRLEFPIATHVRHHAKNRRFLNAFQITVLPLSLQHSPRRHLPHVPLSHPRECAYSPPPPYSWSLNKVLLGSRLHCFEGPSRLVYFYMCCSHQAQQEWGRYLPIENREHSSTISLRRVYNYKKESWSDASLSLLYCPSPPSHRATLVRRLNSHYHCTIPVVLYSRWFGCALKGFR